MMLLLAVLAGLSLKSHAQQHHDQHLLTGSKTLIDITGEPWTSKYGTQHDLGYTGPLSFSHLPYVRCLEDASQPFDIGILGFPFDTTTSYRPGARLGPSAIRSGSRRLHPKGGYSLNWGNSPYEQGSFVLDCGDVPLSAFDNALAIDQMETAYSTLLERPIKGRISGSYKSHTAALAKDGKEHPRIVTLGGDHTIVIHFDAHLDTWPPRGRTPQEDITHGSFFAIAARENLMTNTSIHAGIRCRMWGMEDIEHDEAVGFQVITTDDIDDYGITRVIQKIRERIGTSPVYLSLDIDVIDPGLAPATGTPEAGGWTTREVKRIIRGLAGLNFVGADIVEVAPAYDHAEITGIAASDIVYDFLNMLQLKEPPSPHVGPFRKSDLVL